VTPEGDDPAMIPARLSEYGSAIPWLHEVVEWSPLRKWAMIIKETSRSNPIRQFSCCQHPRFFGKFKSNTHIQMR